MIIERFKLREDAEQFGAANPVVYGVKSQVEIIEEDVKLTPFDADKFSALVAAEWSNHAQYFTGPDGKPSEYFLYDVEDGALGHAAAERLEELRESCKGSTSTERRYEVRISRDLSALPKPTPASREILVDDEAVGWGNAYGD